ncbi:hypothetical protein VCSRO11_0540 [Vibrio cholerae]|nr:hypothetical protein VCSRO11_0540 [Vibrio cholerae]GIB83937.1 hypothetical protein VCSRO190_0006 [Vibrio cholerae]
MAVWQLKYVGCYKVLEFAFSQAQAKFNKCKDEFIFTINNAIVF